ncbi:amino acid transporter AVT1B [Physcomitrium patens]|nr:amino acid transporter AVT1B-like [Physcomitrium patens]XP_024402561.1 amino acid transporter AVT1B-like [Physcomitrium patens]XP_024402562.1 amino acid transporter AVT1B-like [Physcomitrium patens]XP_024402563.1 amino acid transporter AVT1B-like [Physcomitrium patens]PNR34840.1 hypothetical protein PHYPA_022738 [Physcomitrium patens]|eukprot:XP_024402559.1 amino acid transporter AVT1B-like [Physcomitrella patens]
MTTIPGENATKPLLQDHEGTSNDVEHGDWIGDKEKFSRTSCSPSTTKLELLESFDDGPVGVLQSDAQTVLNIVNLYVGVGLLSLGYAFRLGGWISLVVLTAVSYIFAHSAKLICWSFDKVPRSMVQSYPNLGTTAMGKLGHWMVMVMALAEFFGASCMCLIIVWQSIEMLLRSEILCLGSMCLSSRHAVIIGSTVIMLPAIWIRTFSRLTSISFSGVMSSLLLTAVVVISCAADPNREAIHDTSSLFHESVNWEHLPIGAGILVVSLSGHAGLPSMRRSMKNPQNFEHCLNVAFTLMFLLYATMGSISYFYFGGALKVLVTANLNEASGVTGFVLLSLGKLRITINEAVTVLVAMSAYSTIPALIYVIAELIMDMIYGTTSSHQQNRSPGAADLIARTIVMGLAYMVAILAYNVLGSVESTVGGVCSVSVSLLLPSLFYYKLYKEELSASKKAAVLGMCLFGVVCLVGIATINVLELANIILVCE